MAGSWWRRRDDVISPNQWMKYVKDNGELVYIDSIHDSKPSTPTSTSTKTTSGGIQRKLRMLRQKYPSKSSLSTSNDSRNCDGKSELDFVEKISDDKFLVTSNVTICLFDVIHPDAANLESVLGVVSGIDLDVPFLRDHNNNSIDNNINDNNNNNSDTDMNNNNINKNYHNSNKINNSYNSSFRDTSLNSSIQSSSLREGRGILVQGIIPNSRAHQTSQIRIGDVIVEIEDIPVDNTNIDDVISEINGLDEVVVKIERLVPSHVIDDDVDVRSVASDWTDVGSTVVRGMYVHAFFY